MEDNMIEYTIYKLKERFYDIYTTKRTVKEHEEQQPRLTAIKLAIDTINSEFYNN